MSERKPNPLPELPKREIRSAESQPVMGPAEVIGVSATEGRNQRTGPPVSMASAVPKLDASRIVQMPVLQKPVAAKMTSSESRLHRGSLFAASCDILTGVERWLSTADYLTGGIEDIFRLLRTNEKGSPSCRRLPF